MGDTARTRLTLFVLIAYGVTALMTLPMFIGFREGLSLYLFPNAQMFYPAAGVIVGLLVTAEDRKKLPVTFFTVVLVTAAVLAVLALLSVTVTIPDLNVQGQSVPVFTLAGQCVIMVGGVLGWIFLLAEGKQRRADAGLQRRNWGASIAVTVLFTALYLGRSLFSVALSDVLSGSGFALLKAWLAMLIQPASLVMIVNLVPNYFLSMLAFFGEEYGWRYYLQPVMQRRFGLRRGILLLGVVWAVWHVPIDLMYYAATTGLQMVASQLVTCVFMSIAFGYAYMKTGNIWVPVLLHYLNNNLIAVLSGNYSADLLENQTVSWAQVPVSLAIDALFFGWLLLMPVFRKKPSEDPPPAETE